MFSVVIDFPGNPDIGQFAPVMPRSIFVARSINKLVAMVQEFITRHNLGGGNFKPFPIFHKGRGYGILSYNGRITRTGCPHLE